MPDEIRKRFAAMAIDKLGGSTEVAHLLGLDERVVSNWKRRGLPPHTHHALPPLLRELRIDAPPDMFGQLMILRTRVARPPRPKPTKPTNGNAPARRRRS